ncbi:hypothetical protein ACO0SA_001873 [Hanseniaspora valbyensis]
MSFWPFGQNLNSTTNNINKILDEYFSVLHTIEQKQQQINSNNSSNNNSNSNSNISAFLDSNGITITKVNSSSRTSLLLKDNDNIINDNNNSNNSNDDNIQNDNNIHAPLNSKFIDEILDESEIINELNRKNSTLLDFMCFGYFFESDSENGSKISNIEYLVNVFMHCCEAIDKHLVEAERLKKNNENNDIINDNDNNIKLKKNLNNDNNINDNNNNDDDDDDDDDTIKNDFIDEHASLKPLELKPSSLINTTNSNNNLSAQSSHKSADKDRYDSIEVCLKKCEVIGEIFSLNIWLITESLVKTSVYLAKFWSLLSLESFNYDNSLLSSIYLKINTNLLINRQDQFLNFIRTFLLKPGSLVNSNFDNTLFENDQNITLEEIQTISKTKGLVDDMLQYINSSLMNDFFLKIISTDKQDTPTGILELVYEQNLVYKLLDFFQNDLYESDIQTCSCDFLKAIIAISANAPIDDLTIGPNCLTRQLCSDTLILNKLIDIIVKEGGHALGNVVSIVIELIRKNNSDYDQVNLLQTSLKQNPPNSRDPIYLGYMVKKFTDNLHLIFKLLQTPYNNKPNDFKIYETDQNLDKSVRLNSMNENFTPLGFERFRIVELIAELLHCSNMGLMNSRKAELISRKRDSIRSDLPNRLEEALEELRLSASEQENIQDEDNNLPLSPVSLTTSLRGDNNYDKKDMIYSVPGSENSSPVEEKAQSKNYIKAKVPRSVPPSSSSSANNGLSPTGSDLRDQNDINITSNQLLSSNVDETNVSTSNNKDNDGEEEEETILDPTFYDLEEQQIYQIPEMDEFFDIPYISLAQNLKIRENATIGDYFKIRVFDLQIFPYLVSMFLKYPWNNFWHNVIFDILQQIFNGRMDYAYNSFLVYALFNNKNIDQFWDAKDSLNFNNGEPVDFNLCKDLVINGYELSNDYYFKNKISLGFMGHLVLIAEEIVKFSKIYKVDLISSDIQTAVDDVKWVYYVEDILMDTRLMFSKILGGDIISTNGQEEEFLLKLQQEKRQKELMEMGLLDDVEKDELLLYGTQEDLQRKLKVRLLERTDEEVREELIRLEVSNNESIEDNNSKNVEVLESTEI